MKAVEGILRDSSPKDLARYLKWKLAHRSADFIDGPLQKENFAFWRAYLHGTRELPPRWKYCTQIIQGDMGQALGQAYRGKRPGCRAHPLAHRSHACPLQGGLWRGFGQARLDGCLDARRCPEEARQDGAQARLARPLARLLEAFDRREAFYGNELAATAFENHRSFDKIGKPMDRTEWEILPWEPNAYYMASNNELVLPLGELVPPIFDPRSSDGANFGSLGGGTIGHELTHGFDDSGKDMDADGNFVGWWTPDSKARFEEKSACFVRQAESYDILPGSGARIRGKATLGESLADNGGIKLAIAALRKAAKGPGPTVSFEGMSELQQFFLGYAQSWCMKRTDQSLRDQLLSDFHPPEEFRVNAVLSNRPEFAEAFQCKPGARMAPKERCEIW